jgi:hypothetical protein
MIPGGGKISLSTNPEDYGSKVDTRLAYYAKQSCAYTSVMKPEKKNNY